MQPASSALARVASLVRQLSPEPAMSSSSAAPAALLRVLGIAQSYEWGKMGADSAVGQLMDAAAKPNSRDAAAAKVPPFSLQEDKPYAELWMGTHTSGPSRVLLPSGESQLLSEHLHGELPFLFKILSVGKALSIQAHPNESLAQKLHAERPNIYKDPHHKPELACAVTPFEALCAFRPMGQIAQHAREYPELRALMGQQLTERLQKVAGKLAEDDTGAGSGAAGESASERKALLRDVFAALMTPSPQLLAEQIAALQKRLEAEGVKASVPVGQAGSEATVSSSSSSSSSSSAPSCQPLAVAPLMLRLLAQYPGDVGVFAPLLLNAFALPPGGAMFLGPDEPHAYLAGDCVECMACSDNVVRAGLTPKLRDTDVLISMLTYAEHTAQSALMTPQQVAAGVTEFAPPKTFGEFRLRRAEAAAGASAAVSMSALKGASIALVWSGVGTATLSDSTAPAQPLRRGDVFLVPVGHELRLQREEAADGKESLLVFQCAANDAQ